MSVKYTPKFKIGDIITSKSVPGLIAKITDTKIHEFYGIDYRLEYYNRGWEPLFVNAERDVDKNWILHEDYMFYKQLVDLC